MSQDRRSSFGYRRSQSMERKESSVRRRSLDNEAKDDSSLTVEKGRCFLDLFCKYVPHIHAENPPYLFRACYALLLIW